MNYGHYATVRRRLPSGPAVFFCAVASSLGLGCGDGDDTSSPFGSVEEVSAYRQQLEPIIVEVNEIEMDVHTSAVGSSGQATAANLAAAFERLNPRLQAALSQLESIEAPARLAPLHADICRLITLRLEAWDTLLEGWNNEEHGLYNLAEDLLCQANGLIPALNEELAQIDLALMEEAPAPTVAE